MNQRRRPVWDLLFPPRCAVCGEFISDRHDREISRCLCRICYEKYLTEVNAGCAVCRQPYALCLCRPKSFLPDDLVYAVPYDKVGGTCRKLILSCKSRKNADVIDELSRKMVSAAEKRGVLTEGAVLTFVPRAPEKTLKTGLDQAEELARAVSALTGLPLFSFFRRRAVGTEQKELRAADREANADAAFTLTPGAPVPSGGTVLLIDDVVTTGATVNSCTKLLRSAGAGTVICLTAAKSIKSYREYMRQDREEPASGAPTPDPPGKDPQP